MLNEVNNSRPVFLYSALGGQWPCMGQQLYAEEPLFRETIHSCDEEVQRQLGWSLERELIKDAEHYELHSRPEFVQPAITAFQIALSTLFRDRGIHAGAVAGLSMGEVAAAHYAGTFSLPSAMRIACSHTKMMMEQQKLPPSNMAFTYLDLKQVQHYLLKYDFVDTISIAVEMSPSITVLAGETKSLTEYLGILNAQGVKYGIVDIGFAFHSLDMKELEPDFFASLQDLEPKVENVPFFSSVTGKREKGIELDASYLWQMYTKPALFITQIRSLLMAGYRTLVEFSPHPMLTNSVIAIARSVDERVAVLPTMLSGKEHATLNETMRMLSAP